MAKAGGGSLRVLLWVAVLVVLLPTCGVTDGIDRLQETVDESFDEDEPASSPASGVEAVETSDRWADYTSESGLYVIDFPAEPDYTQATDDDRTTRSWLSRSESNTYRLDEFEIGFGMTYDFDVGVAETIDAAADSVEVRQGRSAVTETISKVADTRGGNEGFRFVATVAVDDDPFATIHGAVYNTGDHIVIISMIDTGSDDEEDAERFLRSLRFPP